MAWSDPVSRTTGTLITAAIWNQDVVDNPAALRAGGLSIASQAALDFVYPSSATQFARVAAGTALQVPRINAAATGYEFASVMPTGVMLPYAGAAAPSADWLLCDGTSYLRSAQAALFAVIGTAFGAVDGTHFNVPDFRGRVPIGAGTGTGLTARVLAGQVGAETVALSIAEMPSHGHIQDAHNHTQNAHSHGYRALGGGGGSVYLVDGGFTDENDGTAGVIKNTTATNQASTATNQNTGGGGAHANVQPSLGVNMIIKT